MRANLLDQYERQVDVEYKGERRGGLRNLDR